METVTTSATCRSLEIQESPSVPAQSFGPSSSIKKENEQSDLLNDVSAEFHPSYIAYLIDYPFCPGFY